MRPRSTTAHTRSFPSTLFTRGSPRRKAYLVHTLPTPILTPRKLFHYWPLTLLIPHAILTNRALSIHRFATRMLGCTTRGAFAVRCPVHTADGAGQGSVAASHLCVPCFDAFFVDGSAAAGFAPYYVGTGEISFVVEGFVADWTFVLQWSTSHVGA